VGGEESNVIMKQSVFSGIVIVPQFCSRFFFIYSAAEYSTAQRTIVQNCMVRYSTWQHSTAQYDTVQYRTV
jgi:hypothetical protein